MGCELTVADSGGGVPERFSEDIWKPLLSTKSIKLENKRKQTGTGLGLTIVQSVVDDLQGERRVSKDSELGGACFKIWFPLRED
jgi:signal transduction histidine kinase